MRLQEPDWQAGHCAELAAEAVSAAEGRDIWAEIGGCPRSWREAASLYRRLGIRSLGEGVSKVLGDPLSSPLLAARGDVVMVDGSLGVCRGEVAECVGATVPMRRVEKAWRVRG